MRELERAGLILHGGDVVAAPVLRELEAFAPVEAVFGNMDEPALREALTERREVTVESVTTAEESIAFKLPRELREMPAR